MTKYPSHKFLVSHIDQRIFSLIYKIVLVIKKNSICHCQTIFLKEMQSQTIKTQVI